MTATTPSIESRERFAGLLLGTAVGDSLGLPAEGLSRSRIQRRWRGVWQQRLIFGHGMVSDDTEHMVFVSQALLAHPDNVDAFQRCLAWKLRWWLLSLPAGVGLATARATVRLWLGFSPKRSGVRSAGNGPAMRSAIIGLYFADDCERRRQFVAASTRITHTDPKAEIAAQAIADAAASIVGPEFTREDWVARLRHGNHDAEWQKIVQQLTAAWHSQKTVQEFADSLGQMKGVSGYSYHSIPVALYAWLRHPNDYRTALEGALNCGGDTDTVGAITGALAGMEVGISRIPENWWKQIWEPTLSVKFLQDLATRLHNQKSTGRVFGPQRRFWPITIARNCIFLATVLIHGFVRFVR
jgi:ADP-ribosyl-[dinitrogen reductase] hydrolase